MDAFVCTSPGNVEKQQRELPILREGWAIIKIRRIGICGTDIHSLNGTQPFFNYPRILGHELSADLVDTDGISGFVPGEPVTIIPYFNCGICVACRSGKPNCCERLSVCGVHEDGGMVEWLSVPVQSLVHGHGLSHDELALIEPLAIGAHAIARAAPNEKEFILVIGAGPIGLCCMQFVQLAGAHLIAMDIDPHRLGFCSQMLKPEFVLDAGKEDIETALKEITGGDMPSIVIDATGNLHAINQGFRYLSHGGKYVLVGLQKGAVHFSHPEFHKREATLMSSRNATARDFSNVIDAMLDRRIQPLRMITHKYNFREIARDFREWMNPENRIIKAMVELDS